MIVSESYSYNMSFNINLSYNSSQALKDNFKRQVGFMRNLRVICKTEFSYLSLTAVSKCKFSILCYNDNLSLHTNINIINDIASVRAVKVVFLGKYLFNC